MPYRVPSKFDNKNVGGFVIDDAEIVLFTIKDHEDLQQLVLHEIGHIAYEKANPIEMDEYSAWLSVKGGDRK